MTAVLPSDTHVVSDTGHTTDHNNIVDSLSAITGAAPGGSVTAAQAIATLLPLTTLGDLLYENATPAPARLAGNTTATKNFLTQTGTGSVSAAPAWGAIAAGDIPRGTNPLLAVERTGALGVTLSRAAMTQSAIGIATGTVYVRSIPLPVGTLISNITMLVGSTAKAGGSHGWYVLLDSGLVVRAVSGDQTDAATTWGTTNAEQTLSVAGSAYTTTYSGLYYIGVCIVATTVPNFAGGPNFPTNEAARAPSIGGTSSTGQTTPPTTGTTLTAISGVAASNFYGYVS